MRKLILLPILALIFACVHEQPIAEVQPPVMVSPSPYPEATPIPEEPEAKVQKSSPTKVAKVSSKKKVLKAKKKKAKVKAKVKE